MAVVGSGVRGQGSVVLRLACYVARRLSVVSRGPSVVRRRRSSVVGRRSFARLLFFIFHLSSLE
jgi:hypothetical protein